MSESIIIRKAHEHNLRHIDLDLPRDSMVVITGVSGSGKSSLAFDTLFQEGQRRYVESLSAYARQFIGSMKRPEVESIRGISPTISIDQKTINRNPRSTVGTVIEITDHFRLLFSRLGVPHCPKCKKQIHAQTVEQIVDALYVDHLSKNLMILAPIVQDRKGEYRKELQDLKEAGFARVRIDGTLYRIEDAPILARYEKHTLEIVIDRLVIEPRMVSRIREAVEAALKRTDHQVAFLIDEKDYILQGTELACPSCRISIPELEPRLFSFNDTHGQCPRCKGLGKSYEIEEHLLVPDPSLSIKEGAIKAQVQAGNIMFSKHGWSEFKALASHYGFSLDTPWKDLSAKAKKMILWGSDVELRWKATREGWHGPKKVDKHELIPGVIPVLKGLWDQWHIPMIQKYMTEEVCPDCHGSRLSPIALAVLFRGKNIHELSRWSVAQGSQFFESLVLEPREQLVGREIFKEIRARLGFLSQVGLGYLTLDRGAATLSGGEAQRIRLAGQVGAGLQGVLYVLDEPSIGLHPRDNEQLLQILLRLRNQGNTLIVVEHDEETMRRADYVVDIGPGAGSLGGSVVAAGHWEELIQHPDSLTGHYLAGRRAIEIPAMRRPTGKHWLCVQGASENNLKNIDVKFPLGIFTAVTGVSGSGKSTLVNQILRKALAKHFHGAQDQPGKFKAIQGLEYLDKVIEIDQSPIGRTPRSNPATYTKIFDDIRNLFADLTESKIRGYSKSRFSFNVAGGRCEECEGAGVREIEMQILPNVQVPCEACEGKRFNAATLEIHFKGKTIADILAMTIEEALSFFSAHPKIQKPLKVLHDIGLSYLQLGQPSTTLSGGEAQRMKISTELRRPGTGKTLYLLDEPTTGLHFEDIRRLLECMQQLVHQGNTLVVIEHNLDVVKCADWVIDLGPEAGDEGGTIVAQGTPELIAANNQSHTGRFLKPLLGLREVHALPLSKVAERPKIQYNTKLDHDIVVKGARKHNLKNLDVRIPRHQFTVVTGLSGSGKSSLAFHTLFAEGQRRFVESLSTYARRFLGKMDRGSVDSIQGLAPAIAIDQGSASRSPRSTVATLTELYDYFRILWARLGTPHCLKCAKPAHKTSINDLASTRFDSKSVVQVLAPIWHTGLMRTLMANQLSQLPQILDRLKELGVQRLWVDGQVQNIADFKPQKSYKQIYTVVDRIPVSGDYRARLVEALEKAFEEGNGLVGLLEDNGKTPHIHSQVPGCPSCGWFLDSELDPKNFSFNSHWGACPTCQGLGQIGRSVCPDCGGERLKAEFRSVRILNRNISQVSSDSIAQAKQWFIAFEKSLKGSDKQVAEPLLREIHGRLDFLLGVGLDYLGLDRSGDTLSGGEAQRIRLASQIGSGLEGVLYVLDEPTVGLHQRDTQQLIQTLYRLRDLGNTLVVVEHDLELIQSADHILDLGPGAGEHGGEIVAQGTPQQFSHPKSIEQFPLSRTAAYMGGHLKIGSSNSARPVDEASDSWIQLHEVTKNNLHKVSVRIPVGRLTTVSGVSGSGKSSLVMDCLLPLASSALKRGARKNLSLGRITLPKEVTEVVLVDQDALGGTPRSTPVSYTGVLDHLRKLYAALPQSKIKGFGIGRFSYNKFEGRCEACEGKGYNNIEMHFLSDVWELCEQCKGKRYNAETLTVQFKGKTIADVLDMRIEEAVEFFSAQKSIIKPLTVLRDVGLGYLRLGQSATTLSGGEAQRLKLAAELGRSSRKGILYLLDEPTTGLHAQDIQALWGVLQSLVDQGNTVVLIEHQMDMIRLADWVIDLGPEGGNGGGQVLYQGTLQGLLKSKIKSPTKTALKA